MKSSWAGLWFFFCAEGLGKLGPCSWRVCGAAKCQAEDVGHGLCGSSWFPCPAHGCSKVLPTQTTLGFITFQLLCDPCMEITAAHLEAVSVLCFAWGSRLLWGRRNRKEGEFSVGLFIFPPKLRKKKN